MSMIIETERLFLREMTAEDFDALYKVLADSDSNPDGLPSRDYGKM